MNSFIVHVTLQDLCAIAMILATQLDLKLHNKLIGMFYFERKLFI